MGMNIGRLAQKSGISIAAIRCYESLGLLSGVDRKANGHSAFTGETLAALTLIKSLREAGLTLKEVKAFLAVREDRNAPCGDLAALALENAVKNREKVIQLRQAEERLKGFAAQCLLNCKEDLASTCSQTAAFNF
jgi:DNA-binding transcriptional MerR regulator